MKLRIADQTPAAGSRTRVTIRVITSPSSVEPGGRVKVLVDGKLFRTARVTVATTQIATA